MTTGRAGVQGITGWACLAVPGALAALLVLAALGLQAAGITGQSLTSDEPYHLLAGYQALVQGSVAGEAKDEEVRGAGNAAPGNEGKKPAGNESRQHAVRQTGKSQRRDYKADHPQATSPQRDDDGLKCVSDASHRGTGYESLVMGNGW